MKSCSVSGIQQISPENCIVPVIVIHYPTTSVYISGETGCWELCDTQFPHSHGPWAKSKSPYPLRNHIIPNEVTVKVPVTMGSCYLTAPNKPNLGSIA